MEIVINFYSSHVTMQSNAKDYGKLSKYTCTKTLLCIDISVQMMLAQSEILKS
jgi:hypothetical protein